METQVQGKAVAQRPKNEIATISGAPEEILSSDIKIPYVILGQGLSQAVIDKKVSVGDIFRSSTSEILGDEKKGIDVVFLHYPKTLWVVEFKPKGSDRWKYKGMIPRDAKNETLPWYYFADENGITINGQTGAEFQEGDKGCLPWRRVKLLRAFGILLSDIQGAADEMKKAENGELPDPSKALTPVVFSFRSSSYDAGKDITSFCQRAMGFKQPAFKYVVKLNVKVDKNDEGTFAIWKADTSKPQAVPREHSELIETWANVVNKNHDQIKTDDQAAVE